MNNITRSTVQPILFQVSPCYEEERAVLELTLLNRMINPTTCEESESSHYEASEQSTYAPFKKPAELPRPIIVVPQVGSPTSKSLTPDAPLKQRKIKDLTDTSPFKRPLFPNTSSFPLQSVENNQRRLEVKQGPERKVFTLKIIPVLSQNTTEEPKGKIHLATSSEEEIQIKKSKLEVTPQIRNSVARLLHFSDASEIDVPTRPVGPQDPAIGQLIEDAFNTDSESGKE